MLSIVSRRISVSTTQVYHYCRKAAINNINKHGCLPINPYVYTLIFEFRINSMEYFFFRFFQPFKNLEMILFADLTNVSGVLDLACRW